jgi:peroxiredoxin
MLTMLRSLSLPLLAVAFTFSTLHAGEFNPVLDIGDPGPAWKDLPGTDGEKHSFSDLKDKQAVVIVFTCNSCPYAVDYEDRINALTKKHAGEDGRVAVVAVNVNTVEEDLLPAMKQRAMEKGYLFPYLFDETQEIARAYGASRTPEFFLLDQKRRVVYMGAMDDSPMNNSVEQRYLEEALEATLQGEEVPTAETPPVGCRIRFERRRR